MRMLLIFVDGVGLGKPDPITNPFVQARMPCLQMLLDGRHLTNDTPLPLVTLRASLMAVDACLGVSGLPQSATGQATLLTGINIARIIGYHYGPKPNPEIAQFLNNGNLFNTLNKAGISTALLNAFPPRYFTGIESGYRLPGAIAMAALRSGIRLRTADDLNQGNAISVDLTGIGWREKLGIPNTPILTPYQAGIRLAELSSSYQFSFFEYWLSDIAGHSQDMTQSCKLLESFDQMLCGLLDSWDDRVGMILFISDHGNIEDLGTRHHTCNPVPLLLIGSPTIRQHIIKAIQKDSNSLPDLSNIYLPILKLLIPTLAT